MGKESANAMGASSSATGAMSEALGRVRAHGRLLLVGSLIVDIVLLVVVRHHFSSVGAVEVAGSAFAILTMVTGMFAGVQAGLAVGLFTGTVFYLFVAPSGTTAEKATTLLGILLWNAAAVSSRKVYDPVFVLNK